MDPLSERVESEGFEESFDLKGDGDCTSTQLLST